MGLPVPKIGENWSAFEEGQIIKLRNNRHHMKKGTLCQVISISGNNIDIVPLSGINSFETFTVRSRDVRKN